MHYTRWRRHGDPLVTKYARGTVDERFETLVDRSGGPGSCHPWLGPPDSGGYGRFYIDSARGQRRSHVVAWEQAHGPVPAGCEIDHICHNRAVREGTCQAGICPHRLCCNERHLEAKNRRRHAADTEPYKHPRGTRNGKSKLTEKNVREIKALLRERVVERVIAERYGVTRAAIQSISNGHTWAWL